MLTILPGSLPPVPSRPWGKLVPFRREGTLPVQGLTFDPGQGRGGRLRPEKQP